MWRLLVQCKCKHLWLEQKRTCVNPAWCFRCHKCAQRGVLNATKQGVPHSWGRRRGGGVGIEVVRHGSDVLSSSLLHQTPQWRTIACGMTSTASGSPWFPASCPSTRHAGWVAATVEPLFKAISLPRLNCSCAWSRLEKHDLQWQFCEWILLVLCWFYKVTLFEHHHQHLFHGLITTLCTLFAPFIVTSP